MFPAKKTARWNPASDGDRVMNRRPLVLLALVVASMVASACSDISAPRRDTECRSGVIDSSGRCVETP
jgi:hypothetical protein